MAEDVEADIVALCLGNPPPPAIARIPVTERWVGDVWRAGSLAKIAPQGQRASHRIRRDRRRCRARPRASQGRPTHSDGLPQGLSPRGDVPSVAFSGFQQLDVEAPTMRGLLDCCAARSRARQRRAYRGRRCSMRSVNIFVPIWQGSNDAERRRFLRHLRSLWFVHRHRLAPDVWDLLSQLQSEGVLTVMAGRLAQAEPVAAGYRGVIAEAGGKTRAFAVDWIVNCTGPEERYQTLADPLVRHLFATGRGRAGPCSLASMSMIADCCWTAKAARNLASMFWARPLRPLLEITAAPWIRARAASMADHIAECANGPASPPLRPRWT